MLHFILGTAGTGKTTRLLEDLARTVRRGGRAVWLTPEQSSFEAERLLGRALGPKRSLEVEVLSFTRLAGSIFRRFGGMAGVPVTEAGKYLLMSSALSQLSDRLAVYRKSTVNTAFLRSMAGTCGEMKAAGVSPEELSGIGARCGDSPLGDKLGEIALIYGAYQSLLERGYTDPEDDLMRACALLREGKDFFGGVSVFVDGFTTFMAAEFHMLELVTAQAEEVTFAMTADALHDERQGVGIFSPAKKAMARLIRMADKNGVKTVPPTVLQTPVRYRHPALQYLSGSLLQPGALPYPGEAGEAVRLFPARDTWREWEYVAASISALVREEGYRYNQIAVVAREMSPHLRAAQAMLERYDIPYFVSGREEAENLPLLSGLLAALDAVRSNFDPEAVLLYAKCPIAGLEAAGVAALENYCYSWGVRGAVWHTDFANNPRGLAEALTDEDKHLLEELNALRARIVEPLLRLKGVLGDCTGQSFAGGLYDFLIEIQAADNLTAYARELGQGERETFLERSAQLWDMVMEILDVFGAVLGTAGLTAKRACELFRLAADTARLTEVPQTLDQVLLGQADRIRPGSVRAVFVVGVNQGAFPPEVSAGGLFTDTERREMIALGAEIAAPGVERLVLERYFGYFAMILPSERLTVSYARRGFSGEETPPSMLVGALEEIFPALPPHCPDDTYFIAGEKSALIRLSESWRRDTPLVAALLHHFEAEPGSCLTQRMQRAAENVPHRLDDRQIALALFGGQLRLSPSRVERYYRCPFSCFAADGLGLKKRRKVEFSPLESGNVIHNVLQVMVQRHGGKGLSLLPRREMEEEVRAVIGDYLTQRVEDMQALPERFRYLFGRLTGMLARLLMHLGREFAQSEFEVAAVELPISHREGVKPLELVTPEGVAVTVEGVVDRVDVMEKNGRRYVRVVDYKSGAKQFKLTDILYGLNLQMLLYLFTIQERGEGDLAGAVPAGILYMPVRERYVSAGRDGSNPSESRERMWRMNGLLLEDEEALRGMEQDIAGVFIPASLKKSGDLDAKSSLATYAEMGRLADKVKGLIVDMASALTQGRIDALPAAGGGLDACAGCDYRAVCGWEPGSPAREIGVLNREEFFKLLEEENRHGE